MSQVEDIYQGCDKDADNKGDNVRPSRKGDVLLDNNDETEDKAENEDSNVPPPRCLFVVLRHVCVMSVIISTILRTLVGLLDISTPEQEAMSNEGTDLYKV